MHLHAPRLRASPLAALAARWWRRRRWRWWRRRRWWWWLGERLERGERGAGLAGPGWAFGGRQRCNRTRHRPPLPRDRHPHRASAAPSASRHHGQQRRRRRCEGRMGGRVVIRVGEHVPERAVPERAQPQPHTQAHPGAVAVIGDEPLGVNVAPLAAVHGQLPLSLLAAAALAAPPDVHLRRLGCR